MPTPPSIHAVFAIALALFAIFLFTREKYLLEASSLLVLIVILIWFELFPIGGDGPRVGAQDILSGFGNEALIAISSLMILAKGLETTGALQPIAQSLSGLWAERPQLAFLATLLTVAAMSMFLNNTPVVAAVLPLLVAVSLKARVSPAGILMPIGFATIVGGSATTIGTSTNLLVVTISADLGMRELQMFDFALPVFMVGGVAILYLWLIAPRLLPNRRPPLTDVAPRLFDAKLRINDGGFADGRTLSDVLAHTKGTLRVSRVARGSLSLVKLPSVVINAGDRLHVRDTAENLKEYERLLGATLLVGETEERVGPEHPLTSDQHLAEVVVTQGSVLDQASLDSSRMLWAYELAPLALHRPGSKPGDAGERLAREILSVGDIVLVQGTTEALERLKRSGQVLVLDGRITVPRTERASAALTIMAAVVVFAAFGILRISLAALLGVALMLATRCLTWRDAMGALDRRIILVIVASLALGLALTSTGAANYIASLYVALTGDLPVPLVLAGFIIIMALLTEVVTNNAIAVLGTPIAIGVAEQLGAPIEPFVLGVLFGANMSYLTPVGYQTNLLVMSAGGYQFSDFLRVGVPLQLIMWIGLSIVLPILYDM
ncbi:MAG: SLC13 family permease [Gammaproteobacteria bacterium]|nr:SLC13 family permease [Gammaproteobacteria bacterium]